MCDDGKISLNTKSFSAGVALSSFCCIKLKYKEASIFENQTKNADIQVIFFFTENHVDPLRTQQNDLLYLLIVNVVDDLFENLLRDDFD